MFGQSTSLHLGSICIKDFGSIFIVPGPGPNLFWPLQPGTRNLSLFFSEALCQASLTPWYPLKDNFTIPTATGKLNEKYLCFSSYLCKLKLEISFTLFYASHLDPNPSSYPSQVTGLTLLLVSLFVDPKYRSNQDTTQYLTILPPLICNVLQSDDKAILIVSQNCSF